MRHTLFSYLSTQFGPTATESRGHLPAAAARTGAPDSTKDTMTNRVR
jgi:hypothetical protein